MSILKGCLGFLVVLAYMGAVANKFIYNRWEKRGMHTDDNHYSGWCNISPEANVLHFALRTSSSLF